jgi:hypothetical protein
VANGKRPDDLRSGEEVQAIRFVFLNIRSRQFKCEGDANEGGGR